MPFYLVAFLMVLLGAALGLSDPGLDLAIWAYAIGLALALLLDLLKLFRAGFEAGWLRWPLHGLPHYLMLASGLPLLFFSLFKERPNYEITLAVHLLLWLTSLVGCLWRPKFENGG